jgi:Tol biopolymer transport system component/imidazolonepropionase-like amidohydrolase
MTTWTRPLALTLIALLTLLAPLAVDAKKGKKAKDDDAGKKEEEKWEVSNPPGEWVEITIDTEETTWSDVDVSPDGKTIVFDMLGDIYSVPMAGGEAKALTDGIEWNFQPRFSPDGQHIAFVSDRAGGDNVWVMNADGSNPRAVSEEKEHLVHNPSWSPDGEYIVAKKGFTSTRSIPAGEIWLFHVSGGGGLQITERPFKDKDQKTMAEPVFSPDGRYIYYSQDTTPGRVWQYNKDSTGAIFSIQRLDRVKGETDRYVSGPGGAVRPTPSPDGKHLAFVKRIPGLTSALYLKDVESGKEWAIYDALDRDLQETNGSMGNNTAFAWTPDSGSIVFWAGGKIRRVDVESREASVIPIHVKATKKIHPSLRFPIDVAPDNFKVKMMRWAQMSPKGDKVLFQSLGHLYVRDVSGGEPRRLTSQNEHFEFWPSFSPDGSQIVYTTWNDGELGSVRVVSASGGTGRKVTAQPGHYIEPRFSPDGGKVVYRKITGGFMLTPLWSVEPGIYVAPTDGGEATRVSKSGFDAQFDAAGERVLFSSTVDDTQLALKSVNLMGHDERTHLQGKEATEFRVSPDGRWVAFTEDYNAYVAPFTPTGRKVSVGSGTKSIPVKQVSKRSGEFLHWSADSTKLHWAHGATLYTRELKDAFGHLAGFPEELPDPVETGLDLSYEVAADRPSGTIVLQGGRVVTMRDAGKPGSERTKGTGEVIENGVVVVEGNRIQAVGAAADVAVPHDAKVFDVSGHTIIPGLVDVHAHGSMARSEMTPTQNWALFSNLAFGVTTVHDPSNDTTEIFAAAELQRTGQIVAPRIYSTGTILYGAHVPGYRAKIESLDDAKFHVQRLKDVGAISVKSYQQPRRDQRQQVIAAARELGIMVVPEGGAKFQHNMNEIVDGHTGIEHALSLAHVYDDVLQLWSQSEVGYTPTFGVAYGGLSGEVYWYDRTNVWENERLMRYSPRFIIEPRSIRRPKAPDTHYNHIEIAKHAKQMADLGVDVNIGAHGQREGLAAHWEMWMMAQGGFTPWEAIRGATHDGAWYIGLDGDVGSIEAGKLADLVVIDGNPLEDLRRSEFVAYTMINGRMYEAATMNQVAPDVVERGEFFFEQEGGDTIHPATQEWLEQKQERFGWVH